MRINFIRIGSLTFGLMLSAACADEAGWQHHESASSAASPETLALFHADVIQNPLTAGLYQLAYSAKNDTLWVTSAAGRGAEATSALLKLDANTRKVLATYKPADAAAGGVEGVFGVAVDDAHDRVWVTATRANSVAVYSQADGKRVATFPDVAHSREVAVDEARNVAWASAYGSGVLVAYDTETLKEKRRVTVEGAGPAGLVIDKKSGTLYATDLKGNRIIVVSPDGAEPRLIPAEGGPISIDVSADGTTLYTADQAAGRLSAYNAKTGEVVKRVTTGAGALAVTVEPEYGNVLVANRGAGTISVVHVDEGVVEETIKTNANPNHLEAGDGVVYAVDKSAAGPNREDTLYTLSLSH